MSERNPKIARLCDLGSPRRRRDSITHSSPGNFMIILEDTMIDYILRYLPAKDLLNCCCVRKEWNEKVSQFKGIWKKLCRKYGMFYKEPTGASNESCRQFFAKFARRVVRMKLSLCFRIQEIRYQTMSNISAMHSDGENIAFMNRSDNIRIYRIRKSQLSDPHVETTDIDSGLKLSEEILSIRIDSHKLVVATKMGKVTSLLIRGGQEVGWRDFHRDAFSFDLLAGSDIIACGFIRSVKICNIAGETDRETRTQKNWPIMRVLLARDQPFTENCNYSRVLLFFMDIEKLYIRRFLIRSLGENLSISYMDELANLQLDDPMDVQYNNGFLLNSLCYDGDVLYFPATNSKGIGHELGRYDVTNRQRLDNVRLDGRIKFLLGAGKMNIAVITGVPNEWVFNFQAFDKTTFELRANFEIGSGVDFISHFSLDRSFEPQIYVEDVPTLISEVRYDLACIAKTQWLNGLSENADWGPIICLNVGCRFLKMIWWKERE